MSFYFRNISWHHDHTPWPKQKNRSVRVHCTGPYLVCDKLTMTAQCEVGLGGRGNASSVQPPMATALLPITTKQKVFSSKAISWWHFVPCRRMIGRGPAWHYTHTSHPCYAKTQQVRSPKTECFGSTQQWKYHISLALISNPPLFGGHVLRWNSDSELEASLVVMNTNRKYIPDLYFQFVLAKWSVLCAGRQSRKHFVELMLYEKATQCSFTVKVLSRGNKF